MGGTKKDRKQHLEKQLLCVTCGREIEGFSTLKKYCAECIRERKKINCKRYYDRQPKIEAVKNKVQKEKIAKMDEVIKTTYNGHTIKLKRKNYSSTCGGCYFNGRYKNFNCIYPKYAELVCRSTRFVVVEGAEHLEKGVKQHGNGDVKNKVAKAGVDAAYYEPELYGEI